MPLATVRPSSARWLRERVDAHRALLDQQFAGLVQHQHRLLIRALDRHEPHAGPRHRLTDRRRVDGVVLAPLDIGLDVGRGHQHHLVPHCGELARPIVRRTASLHADPTRRGLGKKRSHLGPAQFALHRRTTFALERMKLKTGLAQINANSDKLSHGRSPHLWRSSDHVLALDAAWAGPSTPSLRAKRSDEAIQRS
jgi:hypothetical protein